MKISKETLEKAGMSSFHGNGMPHLFRLQLEVVEDLHQLFLLVLLQDDEALQRGAGLPGAVLAVHLVLAVLLRREQDVEHLHLKQIMDESIIVTNTHIHTRVKFRDGFHNYILNHIPGWHPDSGQGTNPHEHGRSNTIMRNSARLKGEIRNRFNLILEEKVKSFEQNSENVIS